MQTKKRKMKAGEALVGMKRSGSQLWTRERVSLGFVSESGGGAIQPGHEHHTFVSKTWC